MIIGVTSILSDHTQMVKTSDLVVKGKPSPWKDDTPVIYCMKEVENGKVHLPCRYMVTPKEYEKVDFPSLKTSLRPDQEMCLKELMSKIDESKPCNYIFGHLYTGYGKSRTFLHMAVRLGLPILIIINSDSVRTGWINECQDSLGITPHLAGKELGRYPITIASIQMCVYHKYGRKQYNYYGTVIVDEADVYCTQKSVNELVDLYPKYLLGCSATVVREGDGLDKVLDVFYGPRSNWVVRLKKFDESCSMTLHVLYTPYKIDYIYNMRGKMDWTAMIEKITYIEDRNILIRNLCILHQKKKILVLCKTKNHTETLYNMLRDVGEDVSMYYEKMKTYYDAHVLIATISKAGRGYDDKQVSAAFDGRRFDILILATTMKDTTQALGRTLRGDNLLCYLLVDDNPTMKNHATKMTDANSKRGATIKEEYV